MKIMIASDIHGSALWCARLIDAWRNEGSPRLLLLGDLLYHGPRNDLPAEYAPKKVIEMLNSIREHLLCVRGNCEAEVDQMVLSFPVMADYCVLPLDKGIIYATHGHNHGEGNPPPLMKGDVLLCGHIHLPVERPCGDYIYLNPGSVSLPKDGSPHSYMLLENGVFSWHDLLTGEAFQPLS